MFVESLFEERELKSLIDVGLLNERLTSEVIKNFWPYPEAYDQPELIIGTYAELANSIPYQSELSKVELDSLVHAGQVVKSNYTGDTILVIADNIREVWNSNASMSIGFPVKINGNKAYFINFLTYRRPRTDTIKYERQGDMSIIVTEDYEVFTSTNGASWILSENGVDNIMAFSNTLTRGIRLYSIGKEKTGYYHNYYAENVLDSFMIGNELSEGMVSFLELDQDVTDTQNGHHFYTRGIALFKDIGTVQSAIEESAPKRKRFKERARKDIGKYIKKYPVIKEMLLETRTDTYVVVNEFIDLKVISLEDNVYLLRKYRYNPEIDQEKNYELESFIILDDGKEHSFKLLNKNNIDLSGRPDIGGFYDSFVYNSDDDFEILIEAGVISKRQAFNLSKSAVLLGAYIGDKVISGALNSELGEIVGMLLSHDDLSTSKILKTRLNKYLGKPLSDKSLGFPDCYGFTKDQIKVLAEAQGSEVIPYPIYMKFFMDKDFNFKSGVPEGLAKRTFDRDDNELDLRDMDLEEFKEIVEMLADYSMTMIMITDLSTYTAYEILGKLSTLVSNNENIKDLKRDMDESIKNTVGTNSFISNRVVPEIEGLKSLSE